MATTSIAEIENSETHDVYEVILSDDIINTVVTHTPSAVWSWISKIQYIHRFRLHKLIVGLDVEWRPNFNSYNNNPVATLQLCVGRHCLIFQLLHAPHIPKCLSDFLSDCDYTFVGVGIAGDVQKLSNDHGLRVANFVDLRDLQASRNGWSMRQQIGLKDMAAEVLGIQFQKPKTITLSHWDKPYLSPAQVKYACIDAFVSFEIGRVLGASSD